MNNQLLFNNDHKFIMNKELSDEKKIKYSAVILYLTLFKENYINFNNMTKYSNGSYRRIIWYQYS